MSLASTADEEEVVFWLVVVAVTPPPLAFTRVFAGFAREIGGLLAVESCEADAVSGGESLLLNSALSPVKFSLSSLSLAMSILGNIERSFEDLEEQERERQN